MKPHISWIIAIAIVLVGLLCHAQPQTEAISETDQAKFLYIQNAL